MKQFTLNQRNNTLLAVLRTIKDATPIKHGGICYNVAVLGRQALMLEQVAEVSGSLAMIRELMTTLMHDWPEKAKGEDAYPVEGFARLFSEAASACVLWRDPRRIALLDWLIEQLTSSEPVFVWPDGEWTLKSEYSAEVFGYKGDDYWVIDHPTFTKNGALML